jgi:DNA polymerase-3 subunit beta
MLKLTADRKSLCEAIQRASQGLSSRPQNLVHAGMLIKLDPISGMLEITASDGDVAFTAFVLADTSDSGKIILPGKMLSEISRYFTGNSVSVECRETTAKVISGKSEFTLSLSPGEDYPKWSKSPEPLGRLDAGIFADSVKSVSVAASRIHPVMRGMRLELEDEKLLMTCTDGSRMAFASPVLDAATLKTGIARPSPILAPAAVIDRFSRVTEGEVSFGWTDGINLLGLWTKGLEMVTPLTAGEFHKSWVMIREEHDPQLPVDAIELTRMVKIAALAAGDQGTVKLGFSGGITVQASGDAGYSEVLDADPSGVASFPESLEFTPQYLLDGLTGENVTLSWTGRALMMNSAGRRYLCQPRRKLTIGSS